MLLIGVLILVATMMFISQVARLWFIKNVGDYLEDSSYLTRRFLPWRFGVGYFDNTSYLTRKFTPWRYGDEAPREYSE